MAIRHVLYVEDDTKQSDLLGTIVETLDLPIILHSVESATEALDFLGQRGRHPSAPIISLIIVDLGLPHVSGHELLNGLGEDLFFSAIPVVVYTRSRNEADRYLVARCRAEYVFKDASEQAMADFAKKICTLAHGSSVSGRHRFSGH